MSAISLADIERLAAQSRFDQAESLLAPILFANPNAVAVVSLAARIALARGRLAAAAEHAGRLRELEPASGESWFLTGRIERAQGRTVEAIGCFERAVALQPDRAAFYVSLGVALAALQRYPEAIAAYESALALDPNSFAARNNLANARVLFGQSQAAEGPSAEPALVRQRLQELAELAAGQLAARHYPESQTAAEMALALAPESPQLLEIAATAATQLEQTEKSLDYFLRWSRIASAQGAVADRLLDAYSGCLSKGRTQDALLYAAALSRHRPERGLQALLGRANALVVPWVAPSHAAITDLRRDFEQAIDELTDAGIALPAEQRLFLSSSFYLAFHGHCNRQIMEKIAALWGTAVPGLVRHAPHVRSAARRPGRIRVGFFSRYLYNHSIGKTTEGLVRMLDRRSFEVFLLHVDASRSDARTQRMRAAADHYVPLSGNAFDAALFDTVSALELDILFYQDIGMEPTSYFTAFSRLAPVQCVSFGHPDTTGIPNMDYFVSSDFFEAQEAQDHYSETLHLAGSVPTLAYYDRPGAPRGRRGDPARFGLPTSGALYLCPQTLYKIHPDFDALIHGILSRDPTGHVVLIRQNARWFDRLMSRFASSVGAAECKRIISVGEVPQQDFLELLSCADVILDTVHFNGMNSSLEAFALGVPVVTLPGRLQRGRHTQAMYRSMELAEAVARDAQDYVDIAVRLGTEPDANADLRRKIADRSGVLFENTAIVGQFEEFFQWALERSRMHRP